MKCQYYRLGIMLWISIVCIHGEIFNDYEEEEYDDFISDEVPIEEQVCMDASCLSNSGKSVQERKLIQKIPKFQDILQHHQMHSNQIHQKIVSSETLGFVTPWNGRGYDFAKTFRAKFTYISPVWYQIRQAKNGDIKIEGGQNVDKGWLKELKKPLPSDSQGQLPKIVPRFIFELTSLDKTQEIVKKVINEVIKEKYDGIVLEIPVFEATISFIELMGKSLHEKKKILIQVVPANLIPGIPKITPKLFSRLSNYVDRFAMNAYDYSKGKIGPNAPMKWVTECIKSFFDTTQDLEDNGYKILMGIPFYGYNNKKAIVHHDYLKLLKEKSAIFQWDSNAKESYFEYKDNSKTHKIYYPTLYFLQERFQLVEELGTGISIWELGQGLDYFFDLI